MIGITDVAAEVDQFGIQKYITGLSEFISECTTPMTIAIQGDWGTGKTSIMRMVSNSLKPKFKDNLIWFNTWQFSQFDLGDQLPMLLMSKLINRLGRNGVELKDKAVKIVHGIINITSGLLSQGSTDGQQLADALFEKNFADSFEELTKVFSDLVQKKAPREDDKVIVFVDDLDRLAPKKAVELLEVMKNFFDCEKCVFVLAIDYNVVIRGVKEKYGKDFDDEKGRSFFDKIIQVPFRMPVSSYNIQNYVKDNLQHIGIQIDSDSTNELKYYVELIERSIGYNPRSMKRLFNSFLLLQKVADSGLYADKNKRLMLFALLCMQTKYTAVYDFIARMDEEKVTVEFLSDLHNDESQGLRALELDEDTRASFANFAEMLIEVIDTDDKKGISEAERLAFIEVLNFSQITSNDSKEPQTKRGSRVETELENFSLDYKSSNQVKELYDFIHDIVPAAKLELVMNNSGSGHIAGRVLEQGPKFMDLGGRKDGFSCDLYVPKRTYFEAPFEYEVFGKLMEHYNIAPQRKYFAGRCLCVTVPEKDVEGKELFREALKTCFDLCSAT